MYKNIFVVINPAAGKEEPILSILNKVLEKKKINWEVGVTKKKNDAAELTKKALQQNYDLIIAYGGDGTVTEVIENMFKSKLPLGILPGGTANILAKEIGIPVDSLTALRAILSKASKVEKFDMGICNGTPFFVRITIGDLAKLTKNTSRDLKNKIGTLAYGVTAVTQLGQDKKATYNLVIDGKKLRVAGASLIITNVGNIGIPGLSLIPSISIFDGELDILLIKNSNISSLASLAGDILMQKKSKELISHWKGKKINVWVDKKAQTTDIDDDFINRQRFEIEIVARAVSVVVPKKRIYE